MASVSVDDSFRRFQQTGDPEALGQVFDAVAPRLTLVAAHLAVRDAEDLVQATFVRAIERAAHYDPRRPLWPWLVGILANEARALARRARRHPNPAGQTPAAVLQPDEAAASAEIVEQLAAAVDALPEPYRQVCALRLTHGLEPVQIARALNIPAETARSRLHRGLARLRAVLPAGLAGAVSLVLPQKGLAAIRSAVLESATRLHPIASASVSTLTGAMMTKQSLGIVAAIVLLVAVPISWASLTDPASLPAVEGAPSSVRADSPAARPIDATSASGDGVRRVPAADFIAAAWTIRGRIDGMTAGVTHAAIAGATVRALAQMGRHTAELGMATTDADGRYSIAANTLAELSHLQRATATIELRVDAHGCLPGGSVDRREVPAEPEAIEVNVTLSRGRGSVTGRVVDAHDKVVADAFVNWRRLDPERRPFRGRDRSGRTAADGRFTIWFDEAGEYQPSVGSFKSGFASRPPQACSADAQYDAGQVQLRPFAAVSGRFTMRDGTPLAGYPFDVRHESERSMGMISMTPHPVVIDGEVQPIRHANGTTDARGRFQVGTLEPGRYLVRVRDRFRTAQEFAVDTGARDRDFVLEGQLLDVRIVEDDGDPLPGVDLGAIAWAPGNAPDSSDLVCSTPEPAGGLRSAGAVSAPDARKQFLTPFGAVWLLHAAVPGAASAMELVHRAEPGVSHAEVRLGLHECENAGEVFVAVIDERGAAFGPFEASLHLPISRGLAAGPWQSTAPHDGRSWRAPPGEYLLTVRPGRELMGVPTATAESERAVIVAGEQSHVTISATRLGVIRVRLEGPPPAELVWQDLRATLDDGSGSRPVRSLFVEREDGWEESPNRTVPVGQRFALSVPARTGPVALTLAAQGYRPVTANASVLAGQLNDIVLTMRPE